VITPKVRVNRMTGGEHRGVRWRGERSTTREKAERVLTIDASRQFALQEDLSRCRQEDGPTKPSRSMIPSLVNMNSSLMDVEIFLP
jgi:hypothetical protein